MNAAAAAAALCLSALTVSLFSLCDVQCGPGLWQIETAVYWSGYQSRLNKNSKHCLQPSIFLSYFSPFQSTLLFLLSLLCLSGSELAAIINIFLSFLPSLHPFLTHFSTSWTYKLGLFSFLFFCIPSSLLPFVFPLYLFLYPSFSLLLLPLTSLPPSLNIFLLPPSIFSLCKCIFFPFHPLPQLFFFSGSCFPPPPPLHPSIPPNVSQAKFNFTFLCTFFDNFFHPVYVTRRDSGMSASFFPSLYLFSSFSPSALKHTVALGCLYQR